MNWHISICDDEACAGLKLCYVDVMAAGLVSPSSTQLEEKQPQQPVAFNKTSFRCLLRPLGLALGSLGSTQDSLRLDKRAVAKT